VRILFVSAATTERMEMYERGGTEEAQVTAEWEDGISWMSHPGEKSQRASHALGTGAGVWLLDPLDAPTVEERIASLGDVAGVAVLSAYHARDAGAVARRYDVPVSVPTWMDRVDERIDAPIERYTVAPGGPAAGFHVFPCRPFPLWQEVFLYHEPTATLVAPDSMGTSDVHRVGDERLGLILPDVTILTRVLLRLVFSELSDAERYLGRNGITSGSMSYLRRLQPPMELAGLEPECVLVGHGEPVTDDAADALESALDGARRSFPRALLTNGVDGTRAALGALRE
jgi:hypothetical protein